MRVDESILRVVTALLRVEEDLGPLLFDAAVRRSLIAIASTRQQEAMRRHPAADLLPTNVISFHRLPRGERFDPGDEPA